MACPFHAILGLTNTNGPTAPKARTAQTINLQAAIEQAKQFATRRLPILNEHVLAGRVRLDDFVHEITPVLKPFSKAMFGNTSGLRRFLGRLAPLIHAPSPEEARRGIQQIGFIVDSLERHSQAQRATPGAALAALGPVDAVMTVLGYAAGTVPRSTAYSYWLWNDLNNPIYFTRDPGEAAFHRAVVTIDAMHRQSAALLRPIAVLDELPDSTAAIEQLKQADELQKGVLTAYKHLAAKDESGRFVLTPHFFTTVMRTFLVTYPVGGVSLSGPNAAYLLNQRSVDALTGVIEDEKFESFVREHEARYMPPEDQRQLVADLDCPSVPAQLCAKALDLAYGKILGVPDDEVTGRMAEITKSQRAAFGAYFKLYFTLGKARNVHRAMVRIWLEDEEKKLAAEERESLPVKADQGTGGAKMTDLDAIVKMITANSRVAKLLKAYLATGGSDPLAAARTPPGCGPTPVAIFGN